MNLPVHRAQGAFEQRMRLVRSATVTEDFYR